MNALKTAVALTALAAGNAWAVEADARPWYGKVSVGQSDAEVGGFGLEEGMAYGAALGTSVGPLRVEVGASHLEGDLTIATLNGSATDYRATAYLDLNVGDRASVFAGVGLDYIDAEASAFGTSLDASGDGWHWAVGGAYRFGEGIVGEAQVRQIAADLDLGGGVDLDATEVTVGLRLAL